MTFLLTLLACQRGIDALPGVTAERAWLEDLDLATVAVIGGGVNGRGTLRVQTPDGRQATYPVELHGGVVGGVIELGVAGPFRVNQVELDLGGGPVSGSELLGRYRGWSGGLSIIGGFDHHFLRNRDGVSFDATPFQLGVSANIGYEWVHIGIERVEVEPVVTTATADTGLAPSTTYVDTGAPEASSSGGCGCGGGNDHDSGDTGQASAALLGLLLLAGWRRRST